MNFEVAVGVGASSAPPGSDPGFFGKNSSKIGVQLSTSGAYDIALAAALRSLHFYEETFAVARTLGLVIGGVTL